MFWGLEMALLDSVIYKPPPEDPVEKSNSVEAASSAPSDDEMSLLPSASTTKANSPLSLQASAPSTQRSTPVELDHYLPSNTADSTSVPMNGVLFPELPEPVVTCNNDVGDLSTDQNDPYVVNRLYSAGTAAGF